MTELDAAALARLPEVDPDVPNAARMYDYHLGGSHNFAADRATADRIREVMPWVREAVRANRAFLGRAVRYCQSEGIDQFLDLGSGIPTVGNVHEIARETDPDARVAYVDNEPVTVATADALLADDPLCTITAADLRDPDALFAAPGVRDLLDLSRPVALLTVAVLHFVSDDEDPYALVADYHRRLAPGSAHVLSHVTADFAPDVAASTTSIMARTANPIHARPVARIAALLAGTELVEPGLIDASVWHSGQATPPADHGFIAGVGRLR